MVCFISFSRCRLLKVLPLPMPKIDLRMQGLTIRIQEGQKQLADGRISFIQEILSAVASAGHGSQILIADGNYPCGTTAGSNSHIVYLNLSPGVVSVTDVLRAIVGALPIEAAHVMQTADGSEPPIVREFRALLPGSVQIQPVEAGLRSMPPWANHRSVS